MKLFTIAFWKSALEAAVVGGAAGALAALPVTGSITNLSQLKAGAIGFGTGALYAFIKQLGAVQSVNAVAATANRPLAAPAPAPSAAPPAS